MRVQEFLVHKHTIKNVSILSESRLYLVHKEMDVGAKPNSKNFGDDRECGIEETDKPKFIYHRSTFFFQYQGNQCIVKAT